jgi:hypothetical protein
MFNEFSSKRLEKIVVREVRENKENIYRKNEDNKKVAQPDMRLIESMSRSALMARFSR